MENNSNLEQDKNIENSFLGFQSHAHEAYISKKAERERAFKTFIVTGIAACCMYLSYNIYHPSPIHTVDVVEVVEVLDIQPPLNNIERAVLASEIKVLDFFMANELIISSMNIKQIEQLMWEKGIGEIDFVHSIEDQTIIGITYMTPITKKNNKRVKITIDNKVDQVSGLKNYKLDFYSADWPEYLMKNHLSNLLNNNSVESQKIISSDGSITLSYAFNRTTANVN